jgi:hypothetical protein
MQSNESVVGCGHQVMLLALTGSCNGAGSSSKTKSVIFANRLAIKTLGFTNTAVATACYVGCPAKALGIAACMLPSQ